MGCSSLWGASHRSGDAVRTRLARTALAFAAVLPQARGQWRGPVARREGRLTHPHVWFPQELSQWAAASSPHTGWERRSGPGGLEVGPTRVTHPELMGTWGPGEVWLVPRPGILGHPCAVSGEA